MEDLKVTIHEIKTTLKEIDVEIPRLKFEGVFEDKVKKYSKELRLNGFRKGNIPKRLVAERFREPITNEALETLVESTIKEICEKNQIVPIVPAQVDNLLNEPGKPIQLKARVEVEPQVEITQYQSLGISLPPVSPVSDEEVLEQITQYASSIAEETDSSEPGKVGDVAVGEYIEIQIDGVVHPLGDKKDFRIEIGKDKLQEFNTAFLGSVPGVEKEVSVNYPADYEVATLAGKHGLYKFKITAIKSKILPALDDEFAQKTGSESFQALKDTLKKQLESGKIQENKNKASREAIQKIIEAHPFEVPEARIKNYIEYRVKQSQGEKARVSPQVESQLRPEAIFELKKHRILEQVAEKEKIKPSQEEVDARIQEMADQYGMPFDQVKASLRQSGRIVDIREDLKLQKTVDFILGLH